VLAQVDANGAQRCEVEVLHIGRRRLEDDLILHVLEEAIGILTVAAIGGAARGLNVSDAIGLGAEHAKECLGSHGASADFNIVGLLQNATVIGPKTLQTKNEFLKRQRIL